MNDEHYFKIVQCAVDRDRELWKEDKLKASNSSGNSSGSSSGRGRGSSGSSNGSGGGRGLDINDVESDVDVIDFENLELSIFRWVAARKVFGFWGIFSY
eukprot:Pgem_evm1s1116